MKKVRLGEAEQGVSNATIIKIGLGQLNSPDQNNNAGRSLSAWLSTGPNSTIDSCT